MSYISCLHTQWKHQNNTIKTLNLEINP
ncbi:hypothetical protein QC762_0076200 [Podospora pseudocomata]|uniref:Uncharacterized protein n=1 Tax=Podospora pseudocomata TaxID=2093779 RepID=A0ABR0GAN9_9PEZI|nr:hypothetical protein QC762_0076200 [Podospora pseudocomata]